MKRSLIIVPLVLLVVLNACDPSAEQIQAALTKTRIAELATLTATNMPPTITPFPTPIPDGQWLTNSLNEVGSEYVGLGGDSFMYTGAGGTISNMTLASSLDQLEDTIGSDFTVMDVNFPPLSNNNPALAFQVLTRCECARNNPCCTPEHMFVLTVRELYIAMQKYGEPTFTYMGRVPTPIEELQVVCYDHVNPIGTMVAPWSAVLSFIRGGMSGRDFGMQVRQH
jgi:hypothetical protein